LGWECESIQGLLQIQRFGAAIWGVGLNVAGDSTTHPAQMRRVRPMALSIGGVSKKARKNRFHYRLFIPDKGVYRAERAGDKPWWMWQGLSGGTRAPSATLHRLP